MAYKLKYLIIKIKNVGKILYCTNNINTNEF